MKFGDDPQGMGQLAKKKAEKDWNGGLAKNLMPNSNFIHAIRSQHLETVWQSLCTSNCFDILKMLLFA